MNRKDRRAAQAQARRDKYQEPVIYQATKNCLKTGNVINSLKSAGRPKRSLTAVPIATSPLQPQKFIQSLMEFDYQRKVRHAVQMHKLQHATRNEDMAKPTLEQLLAEGGSFAIGTLKDDSGVQRFYIHPNGRDGDTLDFEVRGNELTQLNASQPSYAEQVHGEVVQGLPDVALPPVDANAPAEQGITDPDPKQESPATDLSASESTDNASASIAGDASASAAAGASEDPKPVSTDAESSPAETVSASASADPNESSDGQSTANESDLPGGGSTPADA